MLTAIVDIMVGRQWKGIYIFRLVTTNPVLYGEVLVECLAPEVCIHHSGRLEFTQSSVENVVHVPEDHGQVVCEGARDF